MATGKTAMIVYIIAPILLDIGEKFIVTAPQQLLVSDIGMSIAREVLTGEDFLRLQDDYRLASVVEGSERVANQPGPYPLAMFRGNRPHDRGVEQKVPKVTLINVATSSFVNGIKKEILASKHSALERKGKDGDSFIARSDLSNTILFEDPSESFLAKLSPDSEPYIVQLARNSAYKSDWIGKTVASFSAGHCMSYALRKSCVILSDEFSPVASSADQVADPSVKIVAFGASESEAISDLMVSYRPNCGPFPAISPHYDIVKEDIHVESFESLEEVFFDP